MLQQQAPLITSNPLDSHQLPTQLIEEIQSMGNKVSQLSVLAQHQYMALMMMDWSPMVAATDRALIQITGKLGASYRAA